MGKKKNVGSAEKNQDDDSNPSRPAVSPPRTSSTPSNNNLDLVGPPVTPIKSILSSTILTPRLINAMDTKYMEEINVGRTSTPIFRRQESFMEQAEQVLKTFHRVKDEQFAVEAKLEEYVSSLSTLDKKWSEGNINLPQGVYAEERQKLLEKEQQLMTSVSFLRKIGSLLMGQWGDRGTNDDWTTIDPVIRCYPDLFHTKKSVKSKRTPQKEKKFRQDLLKAYGSEHEELRAVWCPIARDYVEGATAAHIVNANIGEVTARALFGDDEDHIWSPNNGLIMHKDYEKMIDNGKAVILPVSNSLDETRFKFVLLSKDIGRRTLLVMPTAEELQNRELEFKTAFRPRKEYLYFKFVVTALLRRRRGEVPGHLEDLQTLPSPSRSLWASPGPYPKRSILYKFSRQLGCLSADEANQFWGVESSPLENLSDRFEDLSATLSTDASLASIPSPSKQRRKKTRYSRDVYHYDEDDGDKARGCRW